MLAILGIVELVLRILDRYFEERQRTRIEREHEEFKESLARNHLDRSADRLARRLREYKARHPKG